MARKTERVTIGGSQYQITQLGAVEGRGLYKKFVTAIGPLLREVISGGALDKLIAVGDEENGSSRALQVIAPLLIRALEIVPPELFEEMCNRFAPCCKVGSGITSAGQPMMLEMSEAMFDQHFAGDYASMTAWLGHCVRVNGFLGMMGGESAAQNSAQATS